jgi:hypothetical protein
VTALESEPQCSPEAPIATLLDNVAAFVRRFVVLSEPQAEAVALWVLHTHALDAADTTPYLAVTSAEKRSGKTRLLEVLELVAATPLPTANISDAALFRAVEQLSPTLLLDEIDAVFNPKAREREDLRGLLNAGYRRGAVVRRMGGGNMTTLESFSVFCAKVFAGIGRLPDTIEDRAICIRLERKTRGESVGRFRRRDVADEAEQLRARVVWWAEANIDALRAARPSLPEELDDRAQDVWEPLLAIADAAGVDWPKRARHAAVALSTGEAREDDSLGVRLLADVRRIFAERGCDRLATADLIAALSEDEEAPWGDWHGRGSIAARSLATILRRYGVRSRTIRLDGDETAKGFHLEQFEGPFSRYLPSPDGSIRHTVTTGMDKGIEPIFYPSQNGDVTDTEMAANPHGYGDVTGVTDKNGGKEPEAEDEGYLRALFATEPEPEGLEWR